MSPGTDAPSAWAASQLECWAEHAIRLGVSRPFGIGPAAIALVAPSRLVSYTAWYTNGYFTDSQAAPRCTLLVHEVGDDEFKRIAQRLSSLDLASVVLRQAQEIAVRESTGDRVHLFVRDGSDMSGATAVRVVRALVLDQLLDDGYFFVHGACLSVAGTGTALIGPRGAGKTTLLLQCLDRMGAALVSNDKIALSADGAEVTALGFPISIGIRAGSVLALEDGELHRHLLEAWNGQVGEIDRHISDLDTRITIRPHDIATAARCALQSSCRLHLAIVPQIDARATRPHLLRETDEGAESAWRQHRLATGVVVFPEQAGLETQHPPRQVSVPKLPVYRLIQPPGDGRAATSLIEDLIHRTAAGV